MSIIYSAITQKHAPVIAHADRRLALAQLTNARTTYCPSVPRPAPAYIRAARRMTDSHGRTIRDLRLSITDRCNFRCLYCMDPDVRFAPRETLLTSDEIVRVARVAEPLGVRKIRLTGGEPTLHPDLTTIIAGIRAATNVEIAMITNASHLSREALGEWKAAGLARVTISIDSLRADRFARLTRSTSSPADVLAGVENVIAEGLKPLKLNAVLIRGFNDDEATDLADLARRYDVEMRFIEYMPLDSAHAWDSSKWVSAAETRSAIEGRFPLVAFESEDASSTARTFAFADGSPGRIGFIAPVSSPFCGACSRLRLTADGKLRPCLFSTTEWDLRSLMRAGATDEHLADFLIDATWTKQQGHGIASPEFRQPERPMSAIGG
ncbi:MAG: GTP 3',8-cyclase MoaA [Phycisphaeraceae bacterium]|nr:MAG: GTP 3',8-cyclase MoaA [Phycisphaeraceae bacterium]